MTVRTFYNLEALIQHAEIIVPRIDAVSIDIFDTLFVRRIHDPDLVKFPVSRLIAETARLKDISISWQAVLALRNKIESEHRRRNGAHFPDHEAQYDDYMSEVIKEIFGDRLPDNFLDDVANYELQIEESLIVVRKALRNWIERLSLQGKRVFLVSDIYLPAKYLKRLIEYKGLSPYVEDVLSSADTFNAKASGAAFPLMEKTYELSPHRWLHVGDNPISDGSRPREYGIEALVIRDIREKQRKGISRSLNHFSTRRHFWRGRNVQQIMAPMEGENEDRDPLYVDGYNFFGFLIAFFVHRLMERVRELNINRIYFCSREGWMFHECWQRMVPHLFAASAPPETRYLYVSRLAMANAACANVGMTALNARVALLPAENRDFQDICRVFDLDITKFRDSLDRAGIADDDYIDPRPPQESFDKRHRFAALLGDGQFQEEVRRQGRASRDALERYLESEGFFKFDDVALVDIGWLGTIQHFLFQAISHRCDKPRVHGFLMAATRLMPYQDNYECYMKGLLYDQHKFDLPASTILYVKDLMEELCRAPHPSLLRYELNNGSAQLKFRADHDDVGRAEQQQSEYYRPLHEGIFDGVTRYAIAVNLLNYSTENLRPWLDFLLFSRVAFPRTSEVHRIRHAVHQDDFAGRHEVPEWILRQNKTLWDCAPAMLKFNPVIRLYHMWRHLLKTIRLEAEY